MRAVRALAARPACVLPFLTGLVDFVLFLWLVVVEPLGCAAPDEVCPASGDKAIAAANKPKSQRAERGVEFAECTTLMLPL